MYYFICILFQFLLFLFYGLFIYFLFFIFVIGTYRWTREGPLLIVQWKDRDVVTLMSTCHLGHRTDSAIRHTKSPEQGYRKMRVPRPEAIADYNTHMGGVDKSDQMIKYYEILHKSLKYWKKIFLHMVDLAVFNSFIMFTALQKEHPQDKRLARTKRYAQKDFRIELVKQLGGMVHDQELPPLFQFKASPVQASHLPVYSEDRHHCIVCQHSGRRRI